MITTVGFAIFKARSGVSSKGALGRRTRIAAGTASTITRPSATDTLDPRSERFMLVWYYCTEIEGENSMPDAAFLNLVVVIRSASERTEAACLECVVEQGVRPADVQVVKLAPFSEALRASYRIGSECGKEWLLCVDADVLLRPGAIAEMLHIVAELPSNVCEVQGRMLDKLFATVRPGGVHVYRTGLLRKALECIPQEGTAVRPEHQTLQAMKALGYPWIEVSYVVGLHDFEQYHRDIFRKCFVQAHKHAHHADKLLAIWRAGAATDPDFRTALMGFGAGVQHMGSVLIDIRQDTYRNGFEQTGIKEKEPLSKGAVTLQTVEREITSWVEPDVWHRARGDRVAEHAQPRPSRRVRLKERLRRSGMVRTALYALGWGVARPGIWLQRLVEKH